MSERFELEDDGHTYLMFIKVKDGNVFAFPSGNAEIIMERGLPEEKVRLGKILGVKKEDLE